MEKQKWVVAALGSNFDDNLPLNGRIYSFEGTVEELQKALADATLCDISHGANMVPEASEHERDYEKTCVQFTACADFEGPGQFVFEAWTPNESLYFMAWPLSDLSDVLNPQHYPGSENIPADGFTYVLKEKDGSS